MRCGGGWHHWRLPSSNTQHAYLFLALFLFSLFPSSSFTVRMYLFIHGWWKWTREKKEGNSGSDDEIPGTFFPFLDVIYDVSHTQQETIWGRLFTITSVASLGRVHRKGRGSHYRLTVYKFGVGRGQSYWQIDEATNCRGNKRADVIDENVLCIYRPIDGLLDDGPSLYPWCAHYYYQRRTRLNTPTGEKSRSERMDEPLKQWKRERVVFRGTCFFWRCSSRRLAKKRRREQESMIGASSFYLFLSLSLSLYSLYIYAVRCTYMFDKPR